MIRLKLIETVGKVQANTSSAEAGEQTNVGDFFDRQRSPHQNTKHYFNILASRARRMHPHIQNHLNRAPMPSAVAQNGEPLPWAEQHAAMGYDSTDGLPVIGSL